MDLEIRRRRWIEIQFFYILKDMITLCNGLPAMLDWVQAINVNDAYNPKVVSQLAKELLMIPFAAPSQAEVITVASAFGHPMRQTKKWLGIHNRTYYDTVEYTQNSTHMYIPHFKADQDREIERFVNFIKDIRRLGL